jgi:hypothetical protein
MRVASWSADISRLKKATGAPADLPARCRPPVAQEALRRGVEGDVGGKRGLAHARAAGEDDEVGAVHAADRR